MFDHLIFERGGDFYLDISDGEALAEIGDVFIFKNKNKNKKYLAQVKQVSSDDDQIFLLKIKKEL
jgi:hypothetical protein